MNYRVMSYVAGVLIIVALCVDGAFWYGIGILWVYFAAVAAKHDTVHGRRQGTKGNAQARIGDGRLRR